MKNKEVLLQMQRTGIRQWEIAEAYGVSEGVFSRRMRHELSPKDRQKVLDIIKELDDRLKKEVGE